MNKEYLKKITLPDSPGVYYFLDAHKQILYIGKATSLRSRVRSYFASDINEKRSELIAQMVESAASIETSETDSVLEALILETNLIRTHKPRYNTRSKDDKTYNHLIITNEEWPRVLVVRGKDLAERIDPQTVKYHFGPFPSSVLLKEALKIIRKLFQFYDTKEPVGKEKTRFARGKVDFNRQIGLYPHETNKENYDRTIRHLRLFFQGKKKLVIKELHKEMMTAAKNEEFELANKIKKQIFALEHIQDISLIKAERLTARTGHFLRIEAYDVAHHGGQNMVGVMVVLEGSETKNSDYRKFNIKGVKQANDPAALRELLTRRLNHSEWPLPDIVVVDGNDVQKKVAESVLVTADKLIPVVAVVKDDRHRPERILGTKELVEANKLEILHANAEAHRFSISFHRDKQRKSRLG